jgi:alpha-tubulin suppressor-like RCC1 family protein
LGTLGLNDTANRLSPVLNPFLDKITSISAGYYHSVTLTSTGQIYSTGYNDVKAPYNITIKQGQLGLGDVTTRKVPTLMTYMYLSVGTQIQAAYGYSIILTSNSVFGAGQLDLIGVDSSNPLVIGQLAGITRSLVAGPNYVYAQSLSQTYVMGRCKFNTL